jgi:hypothetical protein
MPVNISGSGATGSINTAILPSSGTFATQSYADTAGGLVKIATETFSAASAVNINNCFSAIYANYRILITEIKTASGNANLQFRFRTSASDNTTSNYQNAIAQCLTGGVSNFYFATANQAILYPVTTTEGSSVLDICNPFATARTNLTVASHVSDGARFGGISFDATTSFDGFSIYPSASTISGTVRVYGYRN